jgi:MFS superfamily sulfate permease-like transporter
MNASPFVQRLGEFRKTFKSDLLASLVVFLVALPLCMGIAIASGAPVAAGLITGIVGGLVVSSLSGCPLAVSGPAAGLTVIIYDLIQRFGLETLGIAVLLCGLIQIVAGALRLGQWFRAVSPAVVKGMLAGIGVLIFASQFHVMIDDKPHGHGWENLATIPAAVWKTFSTPPTFGSTETRSRRTSALHAVGELHRRQVIVDEHAGEYSPHGKKHDDAPARPKRNGPDLATIEAEQADIHRQLSAVAPELDAVAGTLGEQRGERIRQATAQALAASQLALEQLRQDHSEEALVAQDNAVKAFEALLASLKNHSFAAQLGVITILAILLWGGFAPKKLRFIPAPLIAVTAATAVAAAITMPVLFVEVPDRLWDEIHFPSLTVLEEIPLVDLVQMSLLLAVVASAETLLCATAVDQLHSGPRTRYDKELFAQGVGNMVCGALGALPMTGVIVRSSANVQAGGKTWRSGFLHGLWLLVFVMGLAFLLRMIPTASLAAVLVYTGYKLVDIKGLRKLAEYGWGEVGIYAATVITIVAVDLLWGVVVGVVLAALKLLLTFSRLHVELDTHLEKKLTVLKLDGTATFLRLPKLAAALERVPPDAELHVDLEHLNYIDHACLDLLMTWAKQHEATGGRLAIDWDTLHANFYKDKNGNGAARKKNGRESQAA